VRAFEAFVEAGGVALRRFGQFEALSDTMPDRDWMAWPAALQDPENAAVARFAGEHEAAIRFQLYLQWLADGQLAAAAGGLSIGLYRDLAVGTAPDGGEAWSEQQAYARGVSIGSPPDPFSATGQIWCLPPPNPISRDRLGEDLLGPLLQANMRHAGALRIDHAMGLSRLFWVPDGAPGSAGAYVGYDFEANLVEVALESHRARCLVIGEDLGTVQEGFREKLAQNDILSYRVLFFEREGAAFKPAASYPRTAVACVATHDIAPMAGWWRGRDITERQAVGQLDEGAARAAAAERVTERARLAEAVGQPALANDSGGPIEPLIAAVHRFMADTPSMLVATQADDLVGEEVGLNLPGTDRERPNWRRRLGFSTTQLFEEIERRATLPPLPLK
jgi:glycogen operon protein